MTLTEVCQQANITPPIFKKYQMIFKLGHGEHSSSGSGKRKSYTRGQVATVESIAALRRLGIPYMTIKQVLLNYHLFRQLNEDHVEELLARHRLLQRDWQVIRQNLSISCSSEFKTISSTKGDVTTVGKHNLWRLGQSHRQ